MTLSTDNVLVALTGAAYVAPLLSTTPTDADAAWDDAFLDLGYISEDGISEEPSDDTQDIKAWQNGTTVRRLITGSSTTFKFTLIESTLVGLELYHKGSTVTPDGDGASIPIMAPTSDRRAFGFDVVDGDKTVRIVIPDGEVTERGAVTYKNDEPISYELTVTAYPDTDGILAYKYFSELDLTGS